MLNRIFSKEYIFLICAISLFLIGILLYYRFNTTSPFSYIFVFFFAGCSLAMCFLHILINNKKNV